MSRKLRKFQPQPSYELSQKKRVFEPPLIFSERWHILIRKTNMKRVRRKFLGNYYFLWKVNLRKSEEFINESNGLLRKFYQLQIFWSAVARAAGSSKKFEVCANFHSMADNREMRWICIFLSAFEAARQNFFVRTYFVALVLLYRTRTSAKLGKFFDTSSEASKWAGSPIFGQKNEIDIDVTLTSEYKCIAFQGYNFLAKQYFEKLFSPESGHFYQLQTCQKSKKSNKNLTGECIFPRAGCPLLSPISTSFDVTTLCDVVAWHLWNLTS